MGAHEQTVHTHSLLRVKIFWPRVCLHLFWNLLLSQITHYTDNTTSTFQVDDYWWLFILHGLDHSVITVGEVFWHLWCAFYSFQFVMWMFYQCLRHFQMLKLWRRDVPLSERLGEDSPLVPAPGPPPTAAPMGPNISWLPDAPLLSSDPPIFLMTPATQAVSGFFVWTALILTCHQVTASWCRLYIKDDLLRF